MDMVIDTDLSPEFFQFFYEKTMPPPPPKDICIENLLKDWMKEDYIPNLFTQPHTQPKPQTTPKPTTIPPSPLDDYMNAPVHHPYPPEMNIAPPPRPNLSANQSEDYEEYPPNKPHKRKQLDNPEDLV
jgi:hypothetical protein